MSEEGSPSIIPTSHRSELGKGSSFPFGAQFLSEGLRSAPQFTNLSLSFFKPHGWKVADSASLTIAQFSYTKHPPTFSSSKDDRYGMLHPHWEITIFPVPSTLRKPVKEYMARLGFDIALQWLRGNWDHHGRDGKANLYFFLDPVSAVVTTHVTHDLLPAG